MVKLGVRIALAGALLASGVGAQGTPADGLVGQTATLCTTFTGRVPFRFTVDAAEWQPRERDVMVVLLVTATNEGDQAADVSGVAKLRDERGRLFDAAGSSQGINMTRLAREYSVQNPIDRIQPGLSAQVVWAFLVAPTVQQLAITQNDVYRCDTDRRRSEMPLRPLNHDIATPRPSAPRFVEYNPTLPFLSGCSSDPAGPCGSQTDASRRGEFAGR